VEEEGRDREEDEWDRRGHPAELRDLAVDHVRRDLVAPRHRAAAAVGLEDAVDLGEHRALVRTRLGGEEHVREGALEIVRRSEHRLGHPQDREAIVAPAPAHLGREDVLGGHRDPRDPHLPQRPVDHHREHLAGVQIVVRRERVEE
jgi:hypothetical protein